MTPASGETVGVGGHRLKLTNLDKVLYPETGTTKRDVLVYYAAVADVLIPHTTDRPATRKRWVNGVGTPEQPGEVFFQKNLEDSAPDWVARRSITHKTHTNEYPLVNDLATLTWLAQIATLEIHVPQWRFGRNGQPRNPDRLVLDLDPGDGVGLAECAEVAKAARSILRGMGLDPMPVTSGSKGIHLYAALDGSQNSDAVSAVAHELARALEADHPDLVVSEMKKSVRGGKVFVDWSQNNAQKTTVAPYSLRGRFRPTVAAPRTWRELASHDLAQLEYPEVLARVKRRADPLAALDADAEGDRLTTYRSKRDAAKTPEPIPQSAGADADGRSFVIQEHHARALHYDFRLEHGGVLASWALPKGVPTDTKHNHLAVQTEDHPLEYGSFEGHIPKGEYGGGDVSIWDEGTYELEKWRDGKEIIATLTGTKSGGLGAPRKFALIQTGVDGAPQNWLIHLMKDSPAGGSAKVEGQGARAAQPERTTRPSTGSTTSQASTESKATRSSAGSKAAMAPIAPMLATLGERGDIHDENDWAFEMKWDGIRAIATVQDGELRLTSRNGNDMTASYPDLGELVDLVGSNTAMLDGEIVALDKSGRPDFGLLQTRMKLTKRIEVERAVRSTPVRYLIFDLLEQNGMRLTARPYDERRSALEELLSPGRTSSIQVPPAFAGGLDQAIEQARELKLEGVVAKERDAPYAIGRRSRAWIKIKFRATQEVVVGGWRPGNGHRADSIGSLLVGLPEGTGLRYVGRVGTGFTDNVLDDLRATLGARERKTSPLSDVPAADARDAHWVRPDLVGEVEFAEWTSTGRLRQPSWRGWRPDKSPADVVKE